MRYFNSFACRCLTALTAAILGIVTIGSRGWLCGCTGRRSLVLLLFLALYCFHLRSGAAIATATVRVGTIATAIGGRGLAVVLLRRRGRSGLGRLLVVLVAPVSSCLLVKVRQVFIVVAEGVVFISRTGAGAGSDDGAGHWHRHRGGRLPAGIDGRLQLIQHQLNCLLR